MRNVVRVAAVCLVVGAFASCTSDIPVGPTVETSDPSAAALAAGTVESASAKLKVDQSNDVSDQLGFGNGLWGQTLEPKAKNLAQVDLLLIVNQVTEGENTTLGLFTDVTQPPVATTSAFVVAHGAGELRRTVSYRFDPPVPLQKKGMYTLGLYVPGNMSWEFAFDDPYPLGEAVGSDGVAVNPPADFVFTTWELK